MLSGTRPACNAAEAMVMTLQQDDTSQTLIIPQESGKPSVFARLDLLPPFGPLSHATSLTTG